MSGYLRHDIIVIHGLGGLMSVFTRQRGIKGSGCLGIGTTRRQGVKTSGHSVVTGADCSCSYDARTEGGFWADEGEGARFGIGCGGER